MKFFSVNKIILIILIIIPFFAMADNFSLSPPGFSEGKTSEFLDLLAWLLKGLFFTIGIAALVMIIAGGVQYIAAGAQGDPNSIKDAQNKIIMAIGGVVLALASWLILNTINPDLLRLDLDLPQINSSNSGGGNGNVTGDDKGNGNTDGDTNGGGGNVKGVEEYSWQKNGCAPGFSPGGTGKCNVLGNPPNDGFTYACCKKNK